MTAGVVAFEDIRNEGIRKKTVQWYENTLPLRIVVQSGRVNGQ
jgi:hypothetical protein